MGRHRRAPSHGRAISLLVGVGITVAMVAWLGSSFSQAGSVKTGALAPGNNGFVLVDDQALDDIPNNSPHLGCDFRIDFYNYEEGDFTADVTFEGIPPTGGGTLASITDIAIGEDPAGGSDDLDASVPVTLSFDGIEPAQQGFHVKLTIDAEFSQGADVKHKAFWVTCEEEPTPTPTPTPTAPPPSPVPTEPALTG
jgi:hypothetical protein